MKTVKRWIPPGFVSEHIWQAAKVVTGLRGDVSPIELFGVGKVVPVAAARRTLALVLRETVFYVRLQNGNPHDWIVSLDGPPPKPHEPISYPGLGYLFGRHHAAFVVANNERLRYSANMVATIQQLREGVDQ